MLEGEVRPGIKLVLLKTGKWEEQISENLKKIYLQKLHDQMQIGNSVAHISRTIKLYSEVNYEFSFSLRKILICTCTLMA